MPFTPLSRSGWAASTNDATFGAASLAIDGNTTTFWATNGAMPTWLILDMLSPQTFNAITYLSRQDGWNDWPGNVEIYVSTDGLTWGSPVATDTWPGDATLKTLSFASQTKRYLKFNIVSAAAGARIYQSAAELNVGTATPSNVHFTRAVAEIVFSGLPHVRLGTFSIERVLAPTTQRGNIDYDQIRSAVRQGTGSQFQMFGGGTVTAGHAAVYDAHGNVFDGGTAIPAAQVNSDWSAASGVAQILNKPTIPAAQVNSDWSAAAGVAMILNKPAAYALPVATASILGGVKQGSGVTIAGDGTLSAAAGSGTVTSVGLSMPAEFTVSGSPVTSAGTFAVTKVNITANAVYAGPASGGAAQPFFRTLAVSDLPAGTGTVTSVGLAAPAEFTVTGSPVTGSGTLTLAKATQAANFVYAGPASGAAAAPTFRTLAVADIPFGAWQNWTPAITVTGPMTISGVSINMAQFVREGAIVHFYFTASFTLGGTAGTDVNASLPVAPVGSEYISLPATAVLPGGSAQVLLALLGLAASTIILRVNPLTNWSLGAVSGVRVSGTYRCA